MNNQKETTGGFSLNHVWFCVCAAAIVLLPGCLPLPHTTTRSLDVHGRVLNSHTHKPIEGAKVFFSEHPSLSSVTDSDGCFLIKKTRYVRFFATVPEGDWPDTEYWPPKITVSKKDYIPRRLDDDFLDKGEILLEPKQ